MKNTRSLTREESKLVTRNRLLSAAATLLREKEYSAITLSDIAEGAEVTQPAFYRHFKNKEECIGEAVDQQLARIRKELHESREAAFSAGFSPATVREVLEQAVKVIAAQGEGLRLVLREVRRPSSSVRSLKNVRDEFLDDLAKDLGNIAAAVGVTYQDEYLQVVADGLAAIGETLVLGYVDGRYDNPEPIVDVALKYLRGTLPELLEKLGA